MKSKIILSVLIFVISIYCFAEFPDATSRAVNEWSWVNNNDLRDAPKPVNNQNEENGLDLVLVFYDAPEGFIDTVSPTQGESFILGEDSQSITTNVTVYPFYINKYETPYVLWYKTRIKAEMEFGYIFLNPGQEGSTGRRGKEPTENGKFQPVTQINWRDAVVWCNALSEINGLTPCYIYNDKIVRDSGNAAQIDLVECRWDADGYRLPSEAEWEYAARKTKTTFQRGDLPSGSIDSKGLSDTSVDINDIAWSFENTKKTCIVGTTGNVFEQNPLYGTGNTNGLGLFDMSGNVLEFCWDWNGDYETTETEDNSYQGPMYGTSRISRGGSWSEYASYLYAGDRYAFDPDEAYNYMGFRICQTYQ